MVTSKRWTASQRAKYVKTINKRAKQVRKAKQEDDARQLALLNRFIPTRAFANGQSMAPAVRAHVYTELTKVQNDLNAIAAALFRGGNVVESLAMKQLVGNLQHCINTVKGAA